MNKEFFRALALLEEEKGISKEKMLEDIEKAMVAALKKEYEKTNIEVRVHINPDKEDVTFYRQKRIVETVVNEDVEISLEDAKKKSKRYKLGEIYETEIKAKDLKRISASQARQIIINAVRDASKRATAQRLEKKREHIITARVEKIHPQTKDALICFDDEKYQVILAESEQIPGEELKVDQLIKVFVQEAERRDGGKSVIISRRHTGFLRRLFELEVPEIASGDVVLASIARDPGSRSKVSVYSRAEGIDAIGACIGQNKSRIESIVRELAGEKVDIIPYSEDKGEYIKAALSPASVEYVVMQAPQSAQVYVASNQFSLAVGKAGQNVRLAAKLTSSKIDIIDISKAEAAEEEESAEDAE